MEAINFHHAFTSPLRYPGGKGAIADYIKLALKENNLVDGHYVELFAGGAAIAWPLLFEEHVRRVHINDISKSLYAFWQSVFEDTEGLCRLILDIPVTMEEWVRQKRIQSDPRGHGRLDIAFSTFFLNRTNRSGILSGGVIGGVGQAGTWKLDARYNKKDLIARIERIARYKARVSLYNVDAAEFIKSEAQTMPPKTLFYLDPPYYAKGKDLYETHYSSKEHAELALLVKDRLKAPWIISYDAAPEVMCLYSEYASVRYDLSYSAQDRYFGSEIMFFSRHFTIPQVPHPAKVSKKLLWASSY